VLPHVVVRLAVEDDVGDIDLRRDRAMRGSGASRCTAHAVDARTSSSA